MASRSLKIKSEAFPGVSWSTPDPRGGLVEGCRSICMEGGVTHFGFAVVNPLPGVNERTANSNNKP